MPTKSNDELKPCVCEGVTQYMKRCKRNAYITIPNIISGTGVGKDDWKYGRDVHLCNQHGLRFVTTKKPQRVIENGFLQPYNKYGYGSVVLVDVIDWKNQPSMADQSQFWNRRTESKKG